MPSASQRATLLGRHPTSSVRTGTRRTSRQISRPAVCASYAWRVWSNICKRGTRLMAQEHVRGVGDARCADALKNSCHEKQALMETCRQHKTGPQTAPALLRHPRNTGPPSSTACSRRGQVHSHVRSAAAPVGHQFEGSEQAMASRRHAAQTANEANKGQRNDETRNRKGAETRRYCTDLL
jgi:hypothetical protein